jgi:transcriptional regulator with XRE-family HTH domain
MSIKDYCKSEGISLAEFARRMKVRPQKVTEWVNSNWSIYDGVLWSPKRRIGKVYP